MASPSPSTMTMNEALARIQSLERQLACAETLLKKYAARNLSDELVHAGLGPLDVLPPPNATGELDLRGAVNGNGNENGNENGATSSAGKESEASTTTAAAAAATAIDLGPLILRALEMRKQVHAGSLTDERAVADLDEMIELHSLSDEQASTLRAWAGQ